LTKIYFVRHAQPVHDWENDSTRPLTDEGISDSKKVTELLKTAEINCFYSSPYKRSVDTILESSLFYGADIITDERLRERQKGDGGNNYGMFQKRWADFSYCEEGGESLGEVQARNIEAFIKILTNQKDKNIAIGTHGTALSTILNYYNPEFGCEDFLRIIDYMPYIIRLDFNGLKYLGNQELLIIEKEFLGKARADKVVALK